MANGMTTELPKKAEEKSRKKNRLMAVTVALAAVASTSYSFSVLRQAAKDSKEREAATRRQLRVDETTKDPFSASCKQLEDVAKYYEDRDDTDEAQSLLIVRSSKHCPDPKQ
ncbi:MAG: hypothetical protein ABSA33_04600 [Candidatus Micrarchaeaceae archaeon]|jgi:hypothetical protein